MSDPLRIALVIEGPTDLVVLKAAVLALLPNRDIEFAVLQPELSEAFQPTRPEDGLGWAGVYRWCGQTVQEGGGSVSGSVLFRFHDLLIVHLDADVAEQTYGSGHIDDATADLPCEQPCPPPSATTNALREVMLRWMNEDQVPARSVICIPSKSMETWVLMALFPKARTVRCRTGNAMRIQNCSWGNSRNERGFASA